MMDWQLCLYRDRLLFFTPLAPHLVTGDDWNDAPADCNASEPLNTEYITVYLRSDWYTSPDEEELRRINRLRISSRDGNWHSANDYARCVVPILTPIDMTYHALPDIWAGTRLIDLIALAQQWGDEVMELYVPIEVCRHE